MASDMPARPLGPDSLAPVGPGSSPAGSPNRSEDAGFRLLLERLQERTQALQAESRGVADPAGLSDALENARASLEDAVSLGNGLLEAFRAANQRADFQDSPTEENDR